MRILLIDISGSMDAETLDRVRKTIAVGDRVILFDSTYHDHGVMHSKQNIAALPPLYGNGATLIKPALKYIKNFHSDAEVVCITDGYFGDLLPPDIEEYRLNISYRLVGHDETSGWLTFYPNCTLF